MYVVVCVCLHEFTYDHTCVEMKEQFSGVDLPFHCLSARCQVPLPPEPFSSA